MVETVGSLVGSDERRVKGDLERFSDLIETARPKAERGSGKAEQRS